MSRNNPNIKIEESQKQRVNIIDCDSEDISESIQGENQIQEYYHQRIIRERPKSIMVPI